MFTKRSTNAVFCRREVIEAQNIGGGYEELEAVMAGTWIATEDPEEGAPASLTFAEGGSLTIDETAYTYAFPEYYRNSYEGGIPEYWNVEVIDASGSKAGDLSFSHVSTRTDPEGEMSRIQLTVSMNNDYYWGYFEAEPVEITLDNWHQYFELKEIVRPSTNSFDEIEGLSWYWNLALKEEYLPAFVNNYEFAIEYTYSGNVVKILKYDSSDGSFTIEPAGEKEIPPNYRIYESDPYTTDTTMWDAANGTSLTSEWVNSDFFSQEGTVSTGYVTAATDLTISRISGTIFLSTTE